MTASQDIHCMYPGCREMPREQEHRSKQIDEESKRNKPNSESFVTADQIFLVNDQSENRLFLKHISHTDRTDSAAENARLISSRQSRCRSRLRSRQRSSHVFNEIHNVINGGYIPSWYRINSSDDMDKRRIETRLQNNSASNKTLALDMFQKKQTTFKTRTSVSPIKHNELEQEYFSLRKRISVHGDGDTSAREKTNDERLMKSKAVSDLSVETGNKQLNMSASMFDSDSLGINHFRKHILNVKASSKRYRRTLRAEKKQNKSVKFKFKPLYESQMSENSTFVGQHTNSVVDNS